VQPRLLAILAIVLCAGRARAEGAPGASPPRHAAIERTDAAESSTPRPAGDNAGEDGAPEHEDPSATADEDWPDVSHFLDHLFGFLPIVSPITEPAVGFGAAAGLMFLSKSFGDAKDGLGRPNVTFVGGMATSNGSWGVFGGDVRYWLRDHLQTFAAAIYASVNLDYYGIGWTEVLEDAPLRYNLEPKGGVVQAKYRFGASSFWLGLGGQFVSTEVSFAASADTPGLPDYDNTSNLGGGTALAAYDSRDNVFTPLRGTYAEINFGIFGEAPDGAGAFERSELIAIQYIPLPHRLFLGMRGQLSATFGAVPFYFRPAISMRGVSAMRYQGEEVAQLEAELRWQFWGRLSLVAFGGGGGAWNQFEKLDSAQGVFAAGGGLRYEIARAYGIHAGFDVAGSKDTAAVYIQVGSAWMRP